MYLHFSQLEVNHMKRKHCFSITCKCGSLCSSFCAFMDMYYEYSIKWRYEFSHIKSDIATFGVCKPAHYENLNEREWLVDDEYVDELYEYKNLGAVKNYTGSFSSNIQDNVVKTREKTGMIFTAHFLLYGSELFTLTPSLLEKPEQFQLWFVRNIFYVPKFTPKQLLLKLSGLNSVESEIAIKKMAIFGSLDFRCQNGSSCPKPV